MGLNPIRALGCGSLAVGAIMVGGAALSEAAMAAARVLGSESLLSPPGVSGLVEFELRHHLAFSIGQTALGLVTAVVGVGALRRQSWARAALEWLAWFGIVINLVAAPFIVYSYREASPQMRALILGVTAAMTVALTVASLALVRYLRSARIREAFAARAS